MEEELVIERKSRGAQDKEKGGSMETWVSRRYAEHMIAVDRKGAQGEPSRMKDVAKFKDYKYMCDLSTEIGRNMSEALQSSGRVGRDIFLVKPPSKSDSVGAKASMLKILKDMDVMQLRAMVTLDELIANELPANTTDKDMLTTLILKIKSF